MGHRNGWDLCRQIPLHSPGEEGGRIEDLNDVDDLSYNFLYFKAPAVRATVGSGVEASRKYNI